MVVVIGFIQAAMGALSLYGAFKGADAAEDAAKAQAGTEMRTTKEKLFQSKAEERQLAGTTRARAAGSGVKADVGSPLTILAEQAKTYARDRQFISDVGASQASATLQRGKDMASSLRLGGITSALGSFGGSAKSIASAKSGGASNLKSVFGFGG